MNIWRWIKQSKLDRAIDLLIKVNKENRVNGKHLSGVQYLISSCTIHCDAGRGIGKTHYIGTHVTNEDLIIVHNLTMMGVYQKYGYNKNLNIMTLDQVYGSSLIGKLFKKVYIDEPSLCFKNHDKFKFYEAMSHWLKDVEPIIIMLGE